MPEPRSSRLLRGADNEGGGSKSCNLKVESQVVLKGLEDASCYSAESSSIQSCIYTRTCRTEMLTAVLGTNNSNGTINNTSGTRKASGYMLSCQG